MKITRNLLYNNDGKPVSFVSTPNKRGLFLKGDPRFLIMHYTAATTERSSISWFANKAANAAAHLLIDRDGSITQFAKFNEIVWHAGESQWGNLSGMNKYSIGIELGNGGRLLKTGSHYTCAVDKKIIPDNEVVFATHKNESTESAWHNYTDTQMQVATEVGMLLVKTYALTDVLGHEDISPYRKSDPGPAFAMSSFRSKIYGRKPNILNVKTTTTEVNIRSGAGTAFAAITSPLPKNTKVHVLKTEGTWSFVEVIQKVHGLNDLEGWVASKYLTA